MKGRKGDFFHFPHCFTPTRPLSSFFFSHTSFLSFLSFSFLWNSIVRNSFTNTFYRIQSFSSILFKQQGWHKANKPKDKKRHRYFPNDYRLEGANLQATGRRGIIVACDPIMIPNSWTLVHLKDQERRKLAPCLKKDNSWHDLVPSVALCDWSCIKSAFECTKGRATDPSRKQTQQQWFLLYYVAKQLRKLERRVCTVSN